MRFPSMNIRSPFSSWRGAGPGFGRSLLALGCGCLDFAGSPAAARAADQDPPQIVVAVTARGCEPMTLSAPAGRVTFVIANKSSRSVEWEILDGVMVVDERENIAPGFKAKLTTQLKPGAYQMTCGLLDNPHGKLVVTGESAARASAADLVGVAAEYRAGNQRRLAELADALGRLRDAQTAGDRQSATTAFLDAQHAFLAMAPIQDAIEADARPLAEDLAAIGAALLARGPTPTPEAAKRLDQDAARYAAAVAQVVAPASALLSGVSALALELVGEIDAAADIEAPMLARLDAQRAAIARVVQLFAPYARPADPQAMARLDAALDRLRADLLRPANAAGAGADEEQLSPGQHKALLASARAVVEGLAPLPGALGL
jgi:iron uptake system EfeUOB component EfeO/EfeM